MSETKRRQLLTKLGEQKLHELIDKIDDLEIALGVIKEEFEKIKKELPKFSKTEDST